MTHKLIIKANGQSLEKPMKDYPTALLEAYRIKKFPYSAEAFIYRDSLMVVAISHCPTNEKGEKWKM